jgi:hypothetical protein
VSISFRRCLRIFIIGFVHFSLTNSFSFAQSLFVDKSIVTAPILNGYAMTYAFDQCGAPDIGFQLRRASVDLVDYCPYSENEKQEFMKEIQRIEKWGMQASLSKPGTAVAAMDPTCTRILQSEELQVLRQNLTAYLARKMSAGDALQLNCDGSHR